MTTSPYRYDSRQDYAEAYGVTTPAEYDRLPYSDKGTGHHPSICSEHCPCKTRQASSAAETVSRAA